MASESELKWRSPARFVQCRWENSNICLSLNLFKIISSTCLHPLPSIYSLSCFSNLAVTSSGIIVVWPAPHLPWMGSDIYDVSPQQLHKQKFISFTLCFRVINGDWQMIKMYCSMILQGIAFIDTLGTILSDACVCPIDTSWTKILGALWRKDRALERTLPWHFYFRLMVMIIVMGSVIGILVE